MASTKEYRDYVLEQLKLLDNISCRPMMREYLFYYEGVYFGGVYDNRFLVKKTKTNEKFSLSEELPYDENCRTTAQNRCTRSKISKTQNTFAI